MKGNLQVGGQSLGGSLSLAHSLCWSQGRIVDEVETDEESRPVDSVVIGWGDDTYWVRAEGRQPVSIPYDLCKVFENFVHRIREGSPSETVIHAELHRALGEEDADPRSASEGARKAVLKLNGVLSTLGRSPNDKPWVDSERRKGYRLHQEVNWVINKRSIAKRFKEVRRSPTDSQTMAKHTPLRDQRLPAQPWRPKPSDDPDED